MVNMVTSVISQSLFYVRESFARKIGEIRKIISESFGGIGLSYGNNLFLCHYNDKKILLIFSDFITCKKSFRENISSCSN